MRRFMFRDHILPILMIVCCAYLWTETNKVPLPRFEPLGAAFFPRLILTVIMGLCVLLFARNLLAARKGKQPEKGGDPITLAGALRMAGTVGLLALYVVLIMFTEIPYLVLTVGYLFLFGWFLASWNIRRALPVLVAALVVTGLIYAIFGLFLEVFFP